MPSPSRPRAGWSRSRAAAVGDDVMVSIQDEGPGVPGESRGKRSSTASIRSGRKRISAAIRGSVSPSPGRSSKAMAAASTSRIGDDGAQRRPLRRPLSGAVRMSHVTPSSETVHASAVAIDGRAVLIGGLSGTGKSDLALRLIDRGAILVSDDYTRRAAVGRPAASPPRPPTIIGKIEMRGVGIVEMADGAGRSGRLVRRSRSARPSGCPSPARPGRSPAWRFRSSRLAGLEASAPLKVEAALRLIGLPA